MEFNDKQFSVYNGNKVRLEVFGASHAPKIGAKISGLKGESFDLDLLQSFMDRRKPSSAAFSTKRNEGDKVCFESGVKCDGKTATIDDEVCGVIYNTDQRSKDYSNLIKTPRPAHADYVGYMKYGDKFDYRGGGKFSGRMTAPMCIAGGILKQVLEKKGIKITAYISQIGSVKGASYNDYIGKDLPKIKNIEFPLLDDSKKDLMMAEIESARMDSDSVGGVIECVIENVPVGSGEFMFDSIESVISHLAFGVPAVKGIEFGSGFNLSSMRGSSANDSFCYENGVVKTKTNHNGGINGGMANGMPITFRVAIKPTPSIAKEQDTIDLVNKKNVKVKIEGRHDACITPRAVPVIEAISAIAIYDLI